MRFSEVVGKEFYQIGLASRDAVMVDIFFSGACHHHQQHLRAQSEANYDFHLTYFRAHLRHMMDVIYVRGDFSNAKDASLNNRDTREAWDADRVSIPDPEMFDGLVPDERYPLGTNHELDSHLTHLNGPVTAEERYILGNLRKALAC